MASKLNFGGYSLLQTPKDDSLVKWLEYNLPVQSVEIFAADSVARSSLWNVSHNQSNVGISLPNYPARPKPEINTFHHPTGASRFTTFFGLATQSVATQIWGNSSNGTIPQTLVIGNDGTDPDPTGLSLSYPMYCLQPRPLSATTDFWIIPAVDCRYHWKFQSTANLSLTSSSSWSDLISALQTATGQTFTVSSIASQYLVPSWEEFNTKQYDNAAVLLDAVASSVGLRVVVGLDGSISIQSPADAMIANLASDMWSQAAGGDFSNAGSLPANIIVTFPAYSDGVVQCNGQLYQITVPLAGGIAGTEKVIHSSCYADFSTHHGYGSYDPDNQTTLYALANQIASDWQSWQGKKYDYSFNQFKAWKPTGFDNYFEFKHGTQLPDGRRGCQTRVCTLPYDFGVDQQLSQDSSLKPLSKFQIGIIKTSPITAGSSGKVEIWNWDTTSSMYTDENISVTAWDWTSTSVASWPVGTVVKLDWSCQDDHWVFSSDLECDIVQVYGSGSISGGSSCNWAGKIMSPNPSASTWCTSSAFGYKTIQGNATSDCYLVALDNMGSSGANPITSLNGGDLYLGKLLGVYGGLPVYAIHAGGSNVLFEATVYGSAFTSTSTTMECTPTTAIFGSLPPNSGATTYPITAKNDFGLQGPVSRKCLIAGDSQGNFYLIQIQPPSDVLFEGTLAGTLLSTDASTTVNVTGPAIYGGLPGGGGGTVSARNDFAMSGSPSQKVLVAEDILGNYYLIPTTSNPLPILFWTTLSANCLATDTTASCNAGVTKIFGTMAASSFTATNTLSLSGQISTPVLVAGDNNQSGGMPDPNYYLLAVAPDSLWWGTLDGTLATTDSTTAVTPSDTNAILGIQPSGSSTVNNRLSLSGKTGDTVLVVQDSSNGDYYLIAVPDKTKAGVIEFTLTGALSGGSASCTINRYYGSQGDNANPTSATVYDTQGLFPFALTGAKGIAHYDYVNDKYHVIQCQQMCILAYASCGGFTTPSATVSVSSLTPATISPFNQTPSGVSSANNPHALAGSSGDTVLLEFDGTNWNVVNVTHHKQTVRTNLQLSSCNLQEKTRDCVGLWNNTETSFATISGWTTTNVNSVVGVQLDGSCNLQSSTQSFCAIGASSATGYGTISGWSLTNVTAIVDEQWSGCTGGDCALENKTQTFKALCAGSISDWNQYFNPTTIDAVVASRYYTSTHSFQNQTQTIYIFDYEPVNDFADWYSAVSAQPILSGQLQFDGTSQLQFKSTNVYWLETLLPDSSWTTWMNATTSYPVTSLVVSGANLQYKTTQTYVFSVTSTVATTTWETTTDCPTGGG